MFLSLSYILNLLEHYKYWVIIPIAVLEGPIIMVISGFLVFLGYLNIYVAYVVLVFADLFGDILHYAVGKYWRVSPTLKRFAGIFGYSEKSEEYLVAHFDKHRAKTFLLAKISHGVGGAVQVAAGIAEADIKDFIWYSFIGTLFKAALLITIGYYLGSSYVKIDNYLDWIAYITIGGLFFVLLYLASKSFLKDYSKNSNI
ncbi:VTT domain-containing protein [Patescibacteria group bacterium]|nr:VTT domain-containing protein [Patescibacteria group bacterium]